MEKTRCFCGKNEEVLITQIRERKFGHLFNVVRCKNCGLVYVNPRPTQKEIGRYYSPYDLHEFTQASKRKSIIARVRDFYVQFFGSDSWSFKMFKKGRVLDIGCGSGYFDFYLIDKGFDVYGIETNKKIADIARKRGVKVIVGNIDKLKSLTFKKEFFDIIIMRHTIEHFHNPAQAIKLAKTWLKKDGALFIGTTTFDCLERKLIGTQKWLAFQIPIHLYLFSVASLKQLLERENFHARISFESAPTTLVNQIVGQGRPKLAQIMSCFFYPLSFIFAKLHANSLLFVYATKRGF
jgi:2-polyprenyl-3-methyl-5-hydroxy-6-metoxy-1,4-benzoquinol methylase